MNNEIQKSYYAIIPATVRYDKDICPNAKLLYGEITALCNEKGYCWASNEYFSNLYHVCDRSIGNWITSLREKKYIQEDIQHIKVNGQFKTKRKITIIGENIFQPVKEKNFLCNNTDNNNISKQLIPSYNEEKNFEKIWTQYPKKEGKKTAFKQYCLIFRSYKERGYDDKLINRALWHTVKDYAEKMKKEKRQKKFIKNGNTFFENIEDYLKPLEEYIKQEEKQ